MADLVQYVTFGVADGVFAAPVCSVREILDLKPISRLPRAPVELLGMIDVRGQGIPVIDLRALLSLECTEDSLNTRIVVMTAMRDKHETVIGLKTDRVFEVTALDESGLEPPPDFGGNWNDGAIKGLGRRNGSFVTVLDLERLLSAVDLKALPDGDPTRIAA